MEKVAPASYRRIEPANCRALAWSRCTTWLLASALTAVPAGVIAQQPQPAVSGGYTLHQSVQEVVLYCAVLDKHGGPVPGLERNAFRVMEDGRAATITHFSNKDEPVSIALVLDDSGSMQAKRAEIQQAAVTLLRASNSQDETSVTNFADTAYLDQEFTSDMARLQAALAQSKSVSGGTALFDTVISAAEHSARSAHHRRQVILVVTDGRDNASTADLEAAIQRIQTADGPVLYTIGLLYDLPAAESRRARHDLETMAQQTGGLAFFPRSAGQVGGIAAEVAKDIRSQYTVAFRPPPESKGDSFRKVAVTASTPAGIGLVVRTRKGYFRAVEAARTKP